MHSIVDSKTNGVGFSILTDNSLPLMIHFHFYQWLLGTDGTTHKFKVNMKNGNRNTYIRSDHPINIQPFGGRVYGDALIGLFDFRFEFLIVYFIYKSTYIDAQSKVFGEIKTKFHTAIDSFNCTCGGTVKFHFLKIIIWVAETCVKAHKMGLARLFFRFAFCL